MEYASLGDETDRVLRWKKPNPHQREFQLTDGRSVFASLKWEGSRGTRAVGTTADGRWHLRREGARHPLDLQGMLRPRVRIEPAGGGEALEVAPGYSETLNLGGDTTFRWQLRPKSKLGGFHRETGEPLVCFHYSSGAADAEVRIEPAAAGLPELSLLVLVGWYALRDGMG